MSAAPVVTATALGTADAELVARWCDELALVTEETGRITRVYLSPEHARVNGIVAGWMQDAGLTTWQDAAGNLHGRVGGMAPDAPVLLLGSHLDTVVDAGRYDGIVGVLMAVRTAARLTAAGPLPVALEVIAFSDEEGTRFGKALLGSSAVAGVWDESWWDLADGDGVTLREAFTRFGLDPARVGDAAADPTTLAGYLEAHIEQGPYLEQAGQALGVVTSIASARRFSVEAVGEARHAGGTPYERRHDALLAAAEAALAVERICRASHHVGTVGTMTVEPGAVNVVPGLARFSVDLRGEFDDGRDAVWDELTKAFSLIGERRGVSVTPTEVHRAPAVFCAPRLMDAVRAGIESTGETAPMELFSRAGHDAMSLGLVTDVAMLFLRNPDGISHHPDEFVSTPDIALGLDALAVAVEQVARA
ncbi:allantoate deiminase [Curtobacterium sp. PhB142]|uniref:allantoate amidohydrolase n=1 Tax=unclassified Curtobacterium TaxID=257496 RepID=UPI001043BAC7|nr:MULTISPECIES: allantoate amidohydrolase [unclassified Curtobacterium]TCL87028.1 allantoate deiminase [Curtobacterium sp. PhB142]TCM03069.1 allantoate deiminase [Curtobacterium sp. PhB134]TDW71576.1 allantoate deiminase [Curtobacterium sp. PhB25]